MAILRYNILIKKEGNDFTAYVPTLGISDFGKTVEEAQEHIKEAIKCHIEGLIKTNTEVPSPDSGDVFFNIAEVDIPQSIKFAN